MSKFIKIFSIILIIFSMFISLYSVSASNINMNLVDPETPNETIEDTDQTVQEQENSSNRDSITPPYSVGAIAEEGLGLSNILSILLITVGVILILLAIAIIIRLK